VWYAKEKGEWEASRQIESGGMGERRMIEGGEAQYESAPAPAPAAHTQGGNGILSGSTLAALKGYTASSNKRPAPVAGPLVDYGSDDDSD
jgi:hypothetical protein